MEELKKLVEQMNAEWKAFQASNDLRLKELSAKGHISAETEAKIDKHAKAVVELQGQIDEIQKRAQRIGSGGEGGDPKKAAHSKAFQAYLRKGDVGELATIQAGLSVGTDTEGGYTVPDTVEAGIERQERDNVPMRNLCRVIQVSNENYTKLVQLGSATSGWVGEKSARPETGTPTFAELKPFFGEVYANPAVTQKLLDDAGFDIESWLGEEVGIEMAEQENDGFTRGDGILKPKGILGYTLAATADASRALGVIEKMVSGVSGAFTHDNFLNLAHKMKRGYRQGAAWMMSNLSVCEVMKLKDGQNNYLFKPTVLAGQAPTIYGYPVEENDDMPDPAADANAVIFGNFARGYTIVDVRGTRVLRDPFTNKPKVHFYTTKRVGGFVTQDRAFKVLTLSAA